MKTLARTFDITLGIDYTKHPPVISSGLIFGPGNPKVIVNGQPLSLGGDCVIAKTGGIGFLLPMPRKVMSLARPVACKLDWFFGTYQGMVMTGAINVICTI